MLLIVQQKNIIRTAKINSEQCNESLFFYLTSICLFTRLMDCGKKMFVSLVVLDLMLLYLLPDGRSVNSLCCGFVFWSERIIINWTVFQQVWTETMALNYMKATPAQTGIVATTLIHLITYCFQLQTQYKSFQKYYTCKGSDKRLLGSNCL